MLRISERFPDSSLYKVCEDLFTLAKESDKTISWISKPNYTIRILVALFILIMIIAAVALVYSIIHVDFQIQPFGLAEFVQISEAALNEIVLIGAGMIFLVTFETRRKRKRVITATNRLRCFAHIIDSEHRESAAAMLSAVFVCYPI